MIDEPTPRSGDELTARHFGVSVGTARQWRIARGASEGFYELDARLKAESELSDLDAAASITEDDIDEAIHSDDPTATLKDIAAERSERSMRARLGAHVSWANTEDRSARTAPAREGLEQKFLNEAGGDPVRAEHLRKAHFLRMAMKSAEVRRKKKEERAALIRKASGDAGGQA